MIGGVLGDAGAVQLFTGGGVRHGAALQRRRIEAVGRGTRGVGHQSGNDHRHDGEADEKDLAADPGCAAGARRGGRGRGEVGGHADTPIGVADARVAVRRNR